MSSDSPMPASSNRLVKQRFCYPARNTETIRSKFSAQIREEWLNLIKRGIHRGLLATCQRTFPMLRFPVDLRHRLKSKGKSSSSGSLMLLIDNNGVWDSWQILATVADSISTQAGWSVGILAAKNSFVRGQNSYFFLAKGNACRNLGPCYGDFEGLTHQISG